MLDIMVLQSVLYQVLTIHVNKLTLMKLIKIIFLYFYISIFLYLHFNFFVYIKYDGFMESNPLTSDYFYGYILITFFLIVIIYIVYLWFYLCSNKYRFVSIIFLLIFILIQAAFFYRMSSEPKDYLIFIGIGII